ncbi:MAG: glycosyltransferase family 2 protein [Eubacteriales bacterium]|nr:glycosyltransferase family 2 protein [Eubacteriales bacterium]
MKSKPVICILLSTYNGEKYLEQQLDSIFAQTFENFILFVRDDGSSDHTTTILNAYQKKYPERMHIIPNPEKKNLGYMASFWVLLSECASADYYAFCDQDDVWLPYKLENAVSLLKEEDQQLPVLYFCNYEYCDADLNPLHPAPAVSMPITLKDVLFYTPAFGFSIVINDTLRQMALSTSSRERLPHDGWVQKIAAACGKILYDPRIAAYYRRHDKAVTASNKQLFSLIHHWLFHDILGSSMKENHYVLDCFAEEYAALLDPDNKRLLTLFTGSSASPLIWAKRLLFRKRLRPSLGGELALRICFFLNRY